ncbi:MAG: DUF1566 domain-containing protein [Desulfuromonadales bacterium]
MKYYTHIGLKTLVLLMVLFITGGCGKSSGTIASSGTAAGGTGSISARLVWMDAAAKSVGKSVGAAPVGVSKVRIVVSGPGITPDLQNDFDTTQYPNGGAVNSVPAGTGRIITANGLDAADNVIYTGTTSPSTVTVVAGQVSSTVTITVWPIAPVAAPTGFTATAVSTSQINLKWSDNSSNETGFKIERKAGATGTYAQIATTAANVTSYNDTGLSTSITYFYRIRATNSAGDSANSAEVSTTTGGSILLPKTGQKTSYVPGDDGALQKGAPWSPATRFTDNGDGTVTDNLTGLIWLKNANCTDTVAGIANAYGYLAWAEAITWSNGLKNGICGLSDGSKAGDWRLPNRKELLSLVDRSAISPSLPAGYSSYFNGVQTNNYYWSSSTYAGNSTDAWNVYLKNGFVFSTNKTINIVNVWPVRAGQ